MRAAKVANRRQLTGIVVSGDPTPFNLIASAVRTDGVNVVYLVKLVMSRSVQR
jgi:hypothetical protein